MEVRVTSRAWLKLSLLLAFVILCGSLGLSGHRDRFNRSQFETTAIKRPPGARNNLIREREAWFYRQREYPLGYIPGGARLKAFDQLQRMVSRVRALRSSADVAGYASAVQSAATANSIALSQAAWTLIGPQPTLPFPNDPFTGYPTVAGRVTALAFDSRDITNKTIYLGSAEGGLWVSTNGGQTWTPLTDSQPSLAVGSIALNSTTNPTTIYIGTGEENFNLDAYYGAGVLKSTDGGKTWTQDQTFSQATAKGQIASGPYVGSLAIAPNNTQVLLAGVDGFGSNIVSGVWRSSNGGTTWNQVLSLSDSHFPNGSPATAVVFDPSSSGVAYAALGDRFGNSTDGVYKSTDDGATWTPLTTLGIGPGLGRMALAVGPPASSGMPGELLVAIAAAITSPTSPCAIDTSTCSTNLLGLFKSTDAGTTWTKLTNTPDFCGDPTDPTKGQCFYDMAIEIDPQIPTIFYAGGTNDFGGATLIVSTDGGNTWSPDLYAGNNGSLVNTAGQLHTDTHAIAFSPDGSVLAVGNDGGVWMTANVGASSNIVWNDLNGPLAITQFYPGISIVLGNPNSGLGGTQDNGTQVYSGSLEWQQVAVCGDGASTAITPSGSVAYVACAANQGLFSTSIGWAGNGIGSCTTTFVPGCYTAYFAPPLTMDPENPEVLYFGAQAPAGGPAQAIYQTTNGASSWTAISSNLGNFSIVTIGVAPTDSNTVYVGTEIGKVFVTTNAGAGSGAIFTELDNGLPNRAVTQVTADPSTPTTAYAAFSGFSSCSACDGKGHIFETANGGTSWTSITGNLPDIPVNALVVDPALSSTIYAATDVGVFATTDGGNTWTPVVTALPNVAVLGLTLDASTRTLWAGTHGRSMWALQLPQPPTPMPSPVSLTFANQDVGSTSAARSVTLSNTGGMALAITSIGTSGPFSETNTCGSSLAAGASCVVSVTFSPAATGNVNGMLSISDNLRSSPQTIGLSGAGQDFAVSPSPTSASAPRGSSTSFTITVAPQGGVGFTDSVSLACSGQPSGSSCFFSPPNVTPGSGSTTSTLTISTAAPSWIFPLLEPGSPNARLLSLWLGLLLTLAVLAVLFRKGGRKLGFRFASCALLVFLAASIVSCGGGGGAAAHNPGTPPGTYSVTVTGTSNQLQHSTAVTLMVQ